MLQAWVDREVSRVQARLQQVLIVDADPIDVLSAYIDLQLAYFADSPTRALITVAAFGSPPQSVALHIKGFQSDVRGQLLTLQGRADACSTCCRVAVQDAQIRRRLPGTLRQPRRRPPTFTTTSQRAKPSIEQRPSPQPDTAWINKPARAEKEEPKLAA